MAKTATTTPTRERKTVAAVEGHPAPPPLGADEPATPVATARDHLDAQLAAVYEARDTLWDTLLSLRFRLHGDTNGPPPVEPWADEEEAAPDGLAPKLDLLSHRLDGALQIARVLRAELEMHL